MRFFLERLTSLGLAAGLALTFLVAEAQTAVAVRPPLLRVPDAKQPVTLKKLSVSAEVAGTVARTRVEMVLYNPNDRILEGELQFPLLEGQTVSGFALDINGHLRPAVPVEKARGRQVFEEIVSRKTDPALLEKTLGNNFKLRVYPLPAHGERRVALLLTESLAPGQDGRLNYRLPLDLGGQAGDAMLSIRMVGGAASRMALSSNMREASVSRDGNDTIIEWRRGGAKTQGESPVAEIRWKAPSDADLVAVDRFEDADYFYAEVPINHSSAVRKSPRRLVVIWDVSGSGANRDHARELAFLDAYFQLVPNIDVSLIFARNQAAPQPRRMSVAGGKWPELRRALETADYDGATDAAAWAVPSDMIGEGTLALLFSDGLANWGDSAAPPSPVPLYAINASVGGDPQRLRGLAEQSGGGYLDLMRVAPASAAAELGVRAPRLVSLQGRGAVHLVSASARPEGGRLRIAGQLIQETAEVLLMLETSKGELVEKRLAVRRGRSPIAKSANSLADSAASLFPGVAAERWASFSVAALEANRDRHRAEIRRFGQRFGLITEETSLIVLDALDDYLRYEIVPPAGDLRVEYEQRLAQRLAARQRSRSEQLDDVARRFDQRVQWWEKDFPKDEPHKPAVPNASSGGGPVAAPSVTADRWAAPAAATLMPAPALAAAAPAESRQRVAEPGTGNAAAGRAASIQLQKWQPDAPYARRLRDASAAEAYGIYLDERPDHLNSTAFFLDAAEIFFDKGLTDTAIQILSNLAEMNLENRAVLRILAYRLQQAGAVKLALPLLERVKELAPDEPQSWRDLGLAYAEDGQTQKAIDLLWEVVSMPSQGRFADIDLIALAELNALVARTPGLDTSRIDPRLHRNLPLDVRTVLTWDADNTDIDLWVTDPNGEKAYYAHPLTYQGGRMSRDFTAGYGPEEFALKSAKPGRYEVRAYFFGHRQQIVSPYTTLMLRLSTGFGTPKQQDRTVTLRLSGRGEGVLVGTFDVKENP